MGTRRSTLHLKTRHSSFDDSEWNPLRKKAKNNEKYTNPSRRGLLRPFELEELKLKWVCMWKGHFPGRNGRRASLAAVLDRLRSSLNASLKPGAPIFFHPYQTAKCILRVFRFLSALALALTTLGMQGAFHFGHAGFGCEAFCSGS
jgi:hypothetical protein